MSALEVWTCRNLCLIRLLLATREIEMWCDGNSRSGTLILRQSLRGSWDPGDPSPSPVFDFGSSMARQTEPHIGGRIRCMSGNPLAMTFDWRERS